jgi:hypothetical protein
VLDNTAHLVQIGSQTCSNEVFLFQLATLPQPVNILFTAYKMPRKAKEEPPTVRQRLTLSQLASYDDIITDALVDHVSHDSAPTYLGRSIG